MFNCSSFSPLFVTSNPGGGDTCFLQTVVAAAECSVHRRDTDADGFGTIAAVNFSLQTLVRAAS